MKREKAMSTTGYAYVESHIRDRAGSSEEIAAAVAF